MEVVNTLQFQLKFSFLMEILKTIPMLTPSFKQSQLIQLISMKDGNMLLQTQTTEAIN